MGQYIFINDGGGGLSETETQALIDAALQNTVRKLATGVVAVNSVAPTALYTVPAGKKCLVTQIVAHSPSGELSGVVDYNYFLFGEVGTPYRQVTRMLLNSLENVNLFTQSGRIGIEGDEMRIGLAGEILRVDFGADAAQNPAETITFDVLGYLVDV